MSRMTMSAVCSICMGLQGCINYSVCTSYAWVYVTSHKCLLFVHSAWVCMGASSIYSACCLHGGISDLVCIIKLLYVVCAGAWIHGCMSDDALSAMHLQLKLALLLLSLQPVNSQRSPRPRARSRASRGRPTRPTRKGW
jgi:hypothetical protein